MRRREFLKTSVLGAAYFSLSGLTLTALPTAEAAMLSVNLVAELVQKTLVDNTIIPIWQFRDITSPGPGNLASGIQARVGDTITINLSNTLDRPISFHVPGLLDAPAAIAPGASGTYVLNPTVPGSYIFVDGENGVIGRSMGLFGPFVILPAGSVNALTATLTRFVKQFSLVLSELDSRLNSAIATGAAFDVATYKPNYFFINGLSYPNTTTDPSTFLDMSLGEWVAIRLMNAGSIMYPMHFHGYHVNVTLRNRQIESHFIEKDTVLVRVGECVDTMLLVNQVGDYPIHSHYLPAVTANGTYPKGNMLLMHVV